MDIVCSFWGALLWLLVGGIGGWIIHSLFYGSKIKELSDSILDRDRRLMAISRDHKTIIAEKEKKNLSLKSELTHIEGSNSALKIHNTDLRNTIDALRKSQEEQLAILFEPQTEETLDEPSEFEATPTLLSQVDTPKHVNDKGALIKSKRKLKRTRKKLKKALKYSNKLETRIEELLLALKKAPKLKTIIKEVPVVIRKEVQIIERLDRKKLEKLFGFKVPIIKSRKTIQISKKKGKPVVVKS